MNRLTSGQSVGVERPVGSTAAKANPRDRRIKQGCAVGRRVHPLTADGGRAAHGGVLPACGAHYKVAKAAGILLSVVGGGPIFQVCVISNGGKAVLGTHGIEPAREAVGVSARLSNLISCGWSGCVCSRLRHEVVGRLSHHIRGGLNVCVGRGLSHHVTCLLNRPVISNLSVRSGRRYTPSAQDK